MNILAIDQARNGAWAVYDYEKGKLIGYGSYEFPFEQYTYAKAIMHIKELISSVIKAYDVEAVFIEEIQMRVNTQSFKKLAQLQGVLVNLFEENKYLYGFVYPSQWQCFCKARIHSAGEPEDHTQESEQLRKKPSKILSIQFVKDQFGIETENDNLADAICQGYYIVNAIEIIKRDRIIRKKTEN